MLRNVSNGVELHLNTDLSTLTEEQAKSVFGMSSGTVSFDLEV